MRRLATFFLILATTGASARDVRDASTFAAWRAKHDAAVTQFQLHLKAAELHEVLELPELLKSASSWQECNAEPYAVPPTDQWPAVLAVMRLIKELTGKGVLGSFIVHSAYRNPELNACAGGAKGSAHLHAFAVDLTPTDKEDPTAKLCTFWREQGRDWAMGFSRYRSGRLHIDTAGHRTWGSDHTGKSAVCGAA